MEFREAIQAFGTVVRLRQKNISGWEALVRCLYLAEMYKEALEQVQQAIRVIGEKPLLTFYMSAIYFAMGKSKEGLIHLDKALGRSPKLLKKMIALNPSLTSIAIYRGCDRALPKKIRFPYFCASRIP